MINVSFAADVERTTKLNKSVDRGSKRPADESWIAEVREGSKLAADTGQAAGLVSDPSRSHEEKISELYLLAFSRYPNAEELNTALEYLNRKQLTAATQEPEKKEEAEPAPDPVQIAYEDIIWALINTKEFLFNH